MKSSLALLALGAQVSLARRGNPADDIDDTPLPLVIWHGMGDTFNGAGIKEIAALAEDVNPGTFVYTISLAGRDANADRSATFFGNVTQQLDTVCAQLAAHPILSTAPAIDAMGFSQGGQFLRAYVQKCNSPPVRSLVTFGSQHNGIAEFKACGPSEWLCRAAMALLHWNTWGSYVQSRLVPAQYYRYPASESEYASYLKSSNFLADVNNERAAKNKTYAKNLATLENFVMYVFEDDTTVIPVRTGWFDEVNGTETVALRDRALYKEDWLGLQSIDKKGGLRFRSVEGDHMEISDEALNETFTEFFGPYGRPFVPESWVQSEVKLEDVVDSVPDVESELEEIPLELEKMLEKLRLVEAEPVFQENELEDLPESPFEDVVSEREDGGGYEYEL